MTGTVRWAWSGLGSSAGPPGMCGASSASNEKKAELIEDRGHWKGRSEDLEKELGGRTARRMPAGGSLLGALL